MSAWPLPALVAAAAVISLPAAAALGRLLALVAAAAPGWLQLLAAAAAAAPRPLGCCSPRRPLVVECVLVPQ
eukprot:6562675-Pyramimonas_sp.AAC.1